MTMWPRRVRVAAVTSGAILLTILCWPTPNQGGTLDPSWMAALHLAAQQGMHWGTDVMFTYGPLGYLAISSPFFGWTTALSTVFVGLTLFSLAAVMLWAALESLPIPLALLVAFVAMRIAGNAFGFELLQTLVLLGVIFAIRSSRPLPWAAILLVGGLAAGFALVAKFNVGVITTGIVLMGAMAIGPSARRSIVLAVSAALISAVGSWFAAGQTASTILAYISGSLELARGYTGAMGLDAGGLGAALVMLAIALAILVPSTRLVSSGWSTRRRVTLASVLALEVFASFKYGFVRGDHAPFFFIAMLFTTLALLPPLPRWRASAIFVATLILAGVSIGGIPLAVVPSVQPSAARFLSATADLATPSEWDHLVATTRAQARSTYDLPQAITAALPDRTVHIDPWDSGVAVGYPQASWDPEPIFQSYSAYTSSLDATNRDFLASDAAPDLIVRRVDQDMTTMSRSLSIDGRLLMWEQPAATLEMICRYRQVHASAPWQLLERGPNRCGSSRIVGVVPASFGTSVPIPDTAPGEILVVRIRGLPSDLLASQLYREQIWTVLVDEIAYRLVPGTVGDGLLLAMPATVGWSAGFDLGAPIRSLEIVGSSADVGPLTLQFEAIPIAP
jgi:hypothetical protein